MVNRKIFRKSGPWSISRQETECICWILCPVLYYYYEYYYRTILWQLYSIG